MSKTTFSTYAKFLVFYNILVIVYGAFVRATGSGAGCGNHWPVCNGQIIPRPEQIETIIEYAHRLTSALDGLLVIGLVIWAFRAFPKGSPVRFGAVWSLIFIIIEGALGAALVRMELVAYDDSPQRAIWVAAHLVNTLILLSWLTLTGWWSRGRGWLRLGGQGAVLVVLLIGVIGLLVVAAAGAVTALGDTLFPTDSLIKGLQQDFSASAHFLIRLRVWHPVLAILVGVYVWITAGILRSTYPLVHSYSRWVQTLFIIQLLFGALNLFLLAPVWTQLLHLMLADLLWIAYLLLVVETLASPQSQPQSTRNQHQPVSSYLK